MPAVASIPNTVSPAVNAILDMDPGLLESLDLDDLCGVLAELGVSTSGLHDKHAAVQRLLERAVISL